MRNCAHKSEFGIYLYDMGDFARGREEENTIYASYELYLTHVAIRAFMNLIGIRTYYLQNYILCVLVSLLLTSIIIKLQRMMIRAT